MPCQKLLYDTKSKARAAAKRHRRKHEHKGAYPCVVNGTLFHVGQVPDEVLRGEVTRAQFFGHDDEEAA